MNENLRVKLFKKLYKKLCDFKNSLIFAQLYKSNSSIKYWFGSSVG